MATVLSSILLLAVLAAVAQTSTFGQRMTMPLVNTQAAGVLFLSVALAGLWAFGAPAISMVAASVLISGSRRQGDRLASRGALKIACYLSALAMPWAVLVGGVAYFTAWLTAPGPGMDTTSALVWSIFGVALLVWYWILVSRAYEACRYANT